MQTIYENNHYIILIFGNVFNITCFNVSSIGIIFYIIIRFVISSINVCL